MSGLRWVSSGGIPRSGLSLAGFSVLGLLELRGLTGSVQAGGFLSISAKAPAAPVFSGESCVVLAVSPSAAVCVCAGLLLCVF